VFLITGGAGFIGSHLADRLVQRGATVRVLDNFSTGRAVNLAALSGRVEVLNGDLRDRSAVRRAVEGADVVFHQGAIASVPRSIEDPHVTFDVNVTGTLNVLVAAHAAGCRRVVFASSASIYGDDPVVPKEETMLPQPASPYAVSKMTGEHLCAVYHRLHGVETVSLRYFNVFGPRQDPDSPYSGVLTRFLSALRSGEAPTVHGDGQQTRDFVYVDDVVDANLGAATAPGVAGRAFNIGSGRATTLNDALQTLARVCHTDVCPRHEAARSGDIRHSVANIDRARRELGCAVAVPLEEGLARTVAGLPSGHRVG